MPYLSVSNFSGNQPKQTGYVSVGAFSKDPKKRAQAAQPRPQRIPDWAKPSKLTDFSVGNSTSPTPTGPNTVDMAKGFAQGMGRSYLAIGQAISSGDNTTPLIQQSEDTFMGQLTRNLSGTDKPISLAEEDIATFGEKYGGASSGLITAGLTSLDLFGGGGLKGVAGLTKALRETNKVADAAALMKSAGFTDEIIADYAATFAKSKDTNKIREGLVSAEKLQNSTKTLTSIADQSFSIEGRGGIAGRKGLDEVGLAPEKPPSITRTEPALLNKKLKDEARGARYGYASGYNEAKRSITAQLRNTFDTKVTTLTRSNEMDKLKSNIVVRDADRVRQEIYSFTKMTLPPAQRGKFLATVKNAKTQKDLIKAFVRIDVVAQKVALDDAIKNLRTLADRVTDSPAVAVDYRNKIAELIGNYELSGHTNATIARLEATQAYVKRMEAAGEDVALPQAILDKLEILSRTPKENLSISKVQRITADLEMFDHLGRTKQRTKESLYDLEKEARQDELLETASPMNSKVHNRTVGEPPKAWVERYIKLRNYAQSTRLDWRPIDGFADITGMTPMKAALDLSYSGYLDRMVPGIARFKELETKMLELGEGLSPGSRERVGVFGHSRQTDGYEKLANSGITRADVDAIKLTPEEMSFYNAIQDFNKESFPAVKKYSADIYNVDVGEVDNYMSYLTDFDAMNDLESYQRFGTLADEMVAKRTKTTEQGFTKARTGPGTQKVVIDALKISQRHADDVAYMLTMGKDIKQYAEIVSSPEMMSRLGDVGGLTWLQYLDLMARKGGVENSQRLAVLDIVRKNLTVGVLSYRLTTVLVQVTSFTDTVGTIGAAAAFKGVANVSKSKEWRSFVMDNFPEIRNAIGDDIAFREFGSSYMDRVAKVGFKGIVVMDGLMRASAAAGAYEKLALKAGITVDLAKPNKALIAEAEKLTRYSQGSSHFKDQPIGLTMGKGTLKNRSLNRLVYQFQSFMLNRWENLERQIWRTGIKEKEYGKAASAFFWMVVVAAALEEGTRRGTHSITDAITGREREEEEDFGSSVVSNMFKNIPIMGSLLSAMTYSSTPVPVIQALNDTISGANSAVTGASDETKLRGALSAIGGAGALGGIPGISQATQLGRDAIPSSRGGSSNSSDDFPDLPDFPDFPDLPDFPDIPD